MLNTRLHFFLLAICILAMIYLLYKIRAKKLDVKYSLPWLILDLLMLIMAAFPRLIVILSDFFGIATPSNMVFFAALLFLLLIVFVMSRTISRLNGEVKELAQRIALDEVEIKK